MSEALYLSMSEFGRRMGIHSKTVRRLIRRGKIRARDLCGKTMIHKSWLDAWIKQDQAPLATLLPPDPKKTKTPKRV